MSGTRPRLLQMPKKRRGLASGEPGPTALAEAANAGVIESSRGSERAMPAPWRKRRRETDLREAMKVMEGKIMTNNE